MASSTDDFMSFKDVDPYTIETNKDITIKIGGKSSWVAEKPTGRHLLALYTNIKLPPPGSLERRAIVAGGIRTWYTQGSEDDITGLNGPIPCALWGDQRHCLAHTWPHTVSKKPWKFMYRVYAFHPDTGAKMNFKLTAYTREAKIIGDKT